MKMNWNGRLVLLAAVAALLAGCVGDRTNTVNNFGNGPTAQKVEVARPKPVPPKPVPSKTVVLLADQRVQLRLGVQGEGVSEEEKGMAKRIGLLVSGAVSANDVQIVRQGALDVRLLIRPRLQLVDQDGEYYRMNCEVEAELRSVSNARLYGAKKIQVVSPRRVLGRPAAVAKLEEPAGRQMVEWCRAELRRLVNEEVGCSLLTLQLPAPARGKKRDPQRDAALIRAVGEELGKLPNLVSYQLLAQDEGTGTCQYRVAYFLRAYPNGVANEVGALVKGVKVN